MKEEHVDYFAKEIQRKLEQLPRGIEGNSPMESLKETCLEIRILKDAKEHFENN